MAIKYAESLDRSTQLVTVDHSVTSRMELTADPGIMQWTLHCQTASARDSGIAPGSTGLSASTPLAGDLRLELRRED